VLLVDIDGVISLWGFSSDRCPPGTWHNVEGIGHFLSATAAGHLHELAESFDLVWCSGWEERAPEHLPALIGAPDLPHLTFERDVGGRAVSRAHWKLDAVDAYAGDRPVAWIDDALDQACEEWAEQRGAPTLLVHTDPSIGLTDEHVALLRDWAAQQGTP
jgi:HAD domain in Swiss Army Knife RNA repair proteins